MTVAAIRVGKGVWSSVNFLSGKSVFIGVDQWLKTASSFVLTGDRSW